MRLRRPNGLRPLQNNQAAEQSFKPRARFFWCFRKSRLGRQNPLAFWVAPREAGAENGGFYVPKFGGFDGLLRADAETRNTRDGVPLIVLSLATKRAWKDGNGEWQSQTEWHRVTCFGQVAEFASSLRKGAHIHITGFLRSREIETNGTGRGKNAGAKERAWEIRVIRIAKLDRAVHEDPSNVNPAS